MDLEVEKATVANQHRADNLREHLYLSTLRAEEIERAKREFIQTNMPKYLRRWLLSPFDLLWSFGLHMP